MVTYLLELFNLSLSKTFDLKVLPRQPYNAYKVNLSALFYLRDFDDEEDSSLLLIKIKTP